MTKKNNHQHGIAKSRADVHFISFSSLVILRSGTTNSYQAVHFHTLSEEKIRNNEHEDL